MILCGGGYQYIMQNMVDSPPYSGLSTTYLKMVTYLLRNHGYTKKYFEVGANATRHGHLEVVKWLQQNGLPPNAWTCRYAAFSGNLELLQWARENGCTLDKETFSNAATAGHLHILIWAKENGCPSDDNLCATAVGAGNMEVLKWAIANGFPLTQSACTKAARGGHLKMLKFLREIGCPFNEVKILSLVQEALDPKAGRRLPNIKLPENKIIKYENILAWLKDNYPNLDFSIRVISMDDFW
jgi:hypothetical protein